MAGMVSGKDSGLAAATHVSGSTMVVPAAATRLGGVYTEMELVLVQPGKAMVMVTAYVDVGTMENRIVSVSVSAMANDLVFVSRSAMKMVTAFVDVGTIENGIVSVSLSAMPNDLVFANANAFGLNLRAAPIVDRGRLE